MFIFSVNIGFKQLPLKALSKARRIGPYNRNNYHLFIEPRLQEQTQVFSLAVEWG